MTKCHKINHKCVCVLSDIFVHLCILFIAYYHAELLDTSCWISVLFLLEFQWTQFRLKVLQKYAYRLFSPRFIFYVLHVKNAFSVWIVSCDIF